MSLTRDKTTTPVPAETMSANVVIRTRWHQAAVFAGPLSPLVLFLAIPVTSTGGLLMVLGLAVLCCALPLILAFKTYPPLREVARIEGDQLTFQHYGSIPFSSITGYNLDDYIKLERQGRWTLLLQGDRKTPGYGAFYTSFAAAMADWRARHPGQVPLQSYFYGSWKARTLGIAILVGCLVMALAILAFGVAREKLYFLPMFAIFACRLIFSRRHP
ncbi:hypothetical protein P3W85_41860 [Cupriavidus basilensis]|uniref:Uncharacterized protein n=1 Tax=Cupriavidus basilensis TaxID=68895 RepID=A0ABT6B3J9_9BURK|nr:hypothetical protein [Cupriavidus basilensis]MDF3839438.1 hypothetical protein [Cupriavidus basilensis]